MRAAFTPSLRGLGEDRRKVGFLQVWIVAENFVLRHSGCEHIQNVPDGHSEATNTRLTRTLPGHDSDARTVWIVGGNHANTIAQPVGAVRSVSPAPSPFCAYGAALAFARASIAAEPLDIAAKYAVKRRGSAAVL
jgi:hypothetical protein